jgi:hypothetical protein
VPQPPSHPMVVSMLLLLLLLLLQAVPPVVSPGPSGPAPPPSPPGCGDHNTSAAAVTAAVATTGLLPVTLLGAKGDGRNDDLPAIQSAVECAYSVGGVIFFPPGFYFINGSLVLRERFDNGTIRPGGDGVVLRGSNSPSSGKTKAGQAGGSVVTGSYRPQTRLSNCGGTMSVAQCAAAPPVIQIGGINSKMLELGGKGMRLQDLSVVGGQTGIMVLSSADIVFDNVGIEAKFNTSSPDNAAIVIADIFSLFFSQCSFVNPAKSGGSKPSMILRGLAPQPPAHSITKTNWGLHFRSCSWWFGGTQWQQQANDTSQFGAVMLFESSLMEDSATPFLDLVSGATVSQWSGWESISIIAMQNADAVPRQWTSNRQPVVRVNCPAADCSLDNVYLQSVQQGVGDHPAVRCLGRARVGGVTILDAMEDGALDVRDENDRYAGQFVSRSAGGWTIVGPDAAKAANETSLNPSSNSHALSLGQSGETTSRFALEHDGTMRWRTSGSGAGAGGVSDPPQVRTSFDAGIAPPRTAQFVWPAVHLDGSPHGRHSSSYHLQGAAPSDICTCSHDSLGTAEVQLSCHVSAIDTVLVVLRNAAGVTTKCGAGTVRVLLTRVVG